MKSSSSPDALHSTTSIIPIDSEWGASLVVLCMKDLDDWWPSFSGQTLNAGAIADNDLDINTYYHFQLELDKGKRLYCSACSLFCMQICFFATFCRFISGRTFL
jgi:hypothetical protein